MTNDPKKWIRIFDSIESASERIPINHLVRLTAHQYRICLAHTNKGWYAIQDACPHLGESLSKGKINYLNEVTCPWHSHRFNLANGMECEGRSPDALTFPIEVREDGLYLGLPHS
jgi:nitrite reductase/ring-hydroxylating ferredoxin subunit